MAYQSTNPYNGQIVKSFDDIDDAELLIKLTAAQACFDQVWRHKGFAERKAVLSRAAALMRERTQEFAQLITLEMGKLIAQSEGEVKLSAAILDYYAEHAESFLAPEKLNTAKGDAVVESSPIGVLFGVEPWNYPYYQIVRFAAPNLMAGNVGALAFERLLEEAGAPAGAYTNLFITKDQVATVIDDDRIRAVALTGSEGAGAVVAQRAGKNLKKSTLELGGSDAFIVLEDADLDNAVKHAVSGRMGNSGQACTASKRFIVVDALADRFLEKFQTALQGFEAGDPMDRKTTLAPLSSAQALKTLLGQVDEAVSHGARIVMGGQRIEGQRGAFMQPTTRRTCRNSSVRWRCSSGCRMKRRRWHWPTTRRLVWADRCSHRMWNAASAWPGKSIPAWCSSIRPQCRCRTCRSAVSRTQVTGANCRAPAFRSSSTRS